MVTIKNQRGITLIVLVITIVVLLILVTITARTGIENIEHSRMVQFVSYMQMIQKKVDYMVENGDYDNIGDNLNNTQLIAYKKIQKGENPTMTIMLLPRDYHEVEYISTVDNGAYINTGVIPSDTFGFEIEIKTSNTTSDRAIVGMRNGSSTNTRCWIGFISNTQYCGWNNEYPSSNRPTAANNTFYKIQLNYNNDRKYKVNGTAYYSDLPTLSTMTEPFCLMGRDSGGTFTAREQTMKYAKFTNGSTLTHYFVPCYYQEENSEDKKPGVYDIVNNVFYTNANPTGDDFIYGPEVASSAIIEASGTNTIRVFDKKSLAEDLDIDNIDDEIVVNFATREVMSLKGITYNGQKYYTQYDLPGGQKIKSQTPTEREFIWKENGEEEGADITKSINGLNATFTISGINLSNGSLSYSRDNKETWIEITNYTVQGQDVETDNITKAGVYYFKWTDNTDESNYFERDEAIVLELTNSPQEKGELELIESEYDYSDYDSTKWAYAIDNNNTPADDTDDIAYVWIPRFAYIIENNVTYIKFLKGTSELTTDGGYVTDEWVIPEAFGESTGVWINENSAFAEGLDIITEIQNGTVYN